MLITSPADRLPPVSDLSAEDSWFRAPDGRYALLRGMCFGPSAKLEPYLPFKSTEDWQKYETYVDLMLACGFTTLRLPFLWSAFEPECDPVQPRYDEEYLRLFFHYVRKFTEKGFLIFIDLHQDLVGKAFGGGGLPDWVRSEGTRTFSILRNTPLWGLNYVLNKHLRKTFTEFWRNDLTNRTATPPLEHFPVRDRFLEAVERIAELSAANDRVLGIEIFNEPHPALLNDRQFEEEVLPAFYEDAMRRIRKYSKDLYVFVSPMSDWNVNLRSEKTYASYLRHMGDDARVVFAYHYYDSLLTGLHGLHFHDTKREEYTDALIRGVEESRSKGMIPFLTEFGTRQNWRASVVRRHMTWHFEALEHSLTSATYWNVNLYNTKADRDGFMREDFSLLDHEHQPRNLDIATRPYVLLASALPIFMSFNERTKEFEVILQGTPVTDHPTVMYIPSEQQHLLQPVHYAEGYEVSYNGKFVSVSTSNILALVLDAGEVTHEIRVRPIRPVIRASEAA